MEVGYHPEIILAGRRLNDGMGAYVAGEVIKLMVKKSIPVAGSKALVLGITFKENCPDVRNTKVIDIIRHLQSYHVQVDVYDPWANPEEVMHEYGVKTVQKLPASQSQYNAVVLAVAHKEFSYDVIKKLCSEHCVLFDVKSLLNKELVDARL
jgi:UDP-N-acetyl-D-galactosamine dehydrogenase